MTQGRLVRIRLARRRVVFVLLSVTFAVASLPMLVVALAARGAPWHLPAVTLAAAALAWALSVRRLRLRIDEVTVAGLPGARTVRRGAGRVVVEWQARSAVRGSHGSHRVLIVPAGAPPIVVDDLVQRASDARDLGELVAKLAHMPLRLQLRSLQEERAVAELDEPLAERLRRKHSHVVAVARPARAAGVVEEGHDGSVVLRWPLTGARVRTALTGALLAWLVLGGMVMCSGPKHGPMPPLAQRVALLEGVSLCLVVVFFAWLLGCVVLPLAVEIGRDRIAWRRMGFGRVVLFERALSSVRVEGLVQEHGALAVVGDGVWWRIPAFGDGNEPAWVRSLVERALSGLPAGDAPPSATPRAAPTSAPAPPARADGASPLCPRCRAPSLSRVGGPLDEARCALCDGRFLPPTGRERLVEGELGVARDVLQELARAVVANRRVPCASCGAGMSPVRLKGVAVDLCGACGSLWLDRDELAALSGGRYPG